MSLDLEPNTDLTRLALIWPFIKELRDDFIQLIRLWVISQSKRRTIMGRIPLNCDVINAFSDNIIRNYFLDYLYYSGMHESFSKWFVSIYFDNDSGFNYLVLVRC
ncbi:MAG: hypothetical protein Barrevirus10_8 [Barrevirus sp.]|uniref:Uncharacterized protein n=1 Tax=Barrevirus sp. TaxID=2487763 RepID=A0A3G4ZQ73_9VIRU|nr:MAG: hypothetical protein Barrevirus10_8 [Barrevirus sp.]